MKRRTSGVICLLAWFFLLGAANASDVTFTVRNRSAPPRREVVRVSVPLPPGTFKAALPGQLLRNDTEVPVQARVITAQPDGSLRRVMLSFPAKLDPTQTASYRYVPAACSAATTRSQRIDHASLLQQDDGAYRIKTDAYTLRVHADSVRLVRSTEGKVLADLSAFGPALSEPRPARTEVIEAGPWFVWLRWRQDGTDFGREVDIRADKLGRIRATQRIIRHLRKNGWTPDFGFELSAPKAEAVRLPAKPVHFRRLPARSKLVDHPDLIACLRLAGGQRVSLANPLALRQNRGTLEARAKGKDRVFLRFSRLEPVVKENDRLMLQEGMWRTVELIVRPGAAASLAAAIDDPLLAHVDWRAFDAVYHTGRPLEVRHPLLERLVERNLQYMMKMSLDGDDWGNMSSYSPATGKVAINSMVRYNHCRYVWEDWFRTGDPRLRRIALDWSENYRNFSVYYGPVKKYYGGSRRGRRYRDRPGSPHGPGTYMVRFNNAVDFCTKGYCGFWLAYEETGDPRFKEAAEVQARWSAEHVGYKTHEMRNVGMVADYCKLYEYTGDASYLDNALRLWEGFKAKQEPDLLFTQNGRHATGNHLYIYDDAYGYKHPFYKSYIVQYATNALPYLLKVRTKDRRLRDTVFACNDWMAKVQTAGGGWGYPGPTTGGLRFWTEYCHGLMLAHEVRPDEAYLDATQRCLRCMVALFEKHHGVPSGIMAWEKVAGVKNVRELYRLATDRDRNKDYTHGRAVFSSSPDSTVYLQVVLRDYLRYREESSLFTRDEILEKILRLPTSLRSTTPKAPGRGGG